MPSLSEIKAAGRAKAKAAKEALAKEEALAGGADALWASAFDYVYNSAAADPTAAQAFASLPDDASVLVVVPGFSSWSALTAQHVDAWVSSAITVDPSSSATPAKTVAFKWDCGDVRWAGDDVWTEAAAAWQGAHESAAAAAQALTTLCTALRAAPNRRVVVAAHSLGARVALGACVTGRGAPQPLVDGLVLLGAAVDDCAIGSDADAEFQLTPLLAACCGALTLVHSSRDPTLTKLWAAGGYAPHSPPLPSNQSLLTVLPRTLTAGEYARCGRIAPPALGAAGPAWSGGATEGPTGPDAVARIDASEMLSEHDPAAYVALPPVAAALRAALFSAR